MKATRRAVACATAAAVAAAAAGAAADAAADLATCIEESDLDMDLLDALVEHDPVDDIKSLVISDPGVGWFVSIARHLHEQPVFGMRRHRQRACAPQVRQRDRLALRLRTTIRVCFEGRQGREACLAGLLRRAAIGSVPRLPGERRQRKRRYESEL